MIRKVENTESLSVSVYLKNGAVYTRCDVTDKLMGEHERFISFWYEDSILIFPLERVKRIVFHFEEVV